MYQLKESALNKVYKVAKKEKKDYFTKKKFFEIYHSGDKRWFSEEFGYYYAKIIFQEYVKAGIYYTSEDEFEAPAKLLLIPNFKDKFCTEEMPGFWKIGNKFYSFENIEGVEDICDLKEFQRMYLNHEKEVILILLDSYKERIKKAEELMKTSSIKKMWIELGHLDRGLCYYAKKVLKIDELNKYDFIISKMDCKEEWYWIYPPNKSEKGDVYLQKCREGWDYRIKLLSECLKENAQKIFDLK